MGNEINFLQTSALHYNIFSLQGEITITSLIPITGELNKQINSESAKDLVIDLSEAEYIDSSGIRLLVNLKKKIEKRNKQFFILKPSEAVKNILIPTNMIEILTVIDSSEELDKKMKANLFQTYLPYTIKENEQNRITCSCSVCGSKNVVGYLLDDNLFDWQWVDDDPFPSALDKNSKKYFDYFSIRPIICLECFMSSIKISDFNILSDDNTVIKAKINEESRKMLAKTIKKRKKIVDYQSIPSNEFFQFPRDRSATYKAYQLAEFCTRTISVLKIDASPFDIGYLNYLAICYAESKTKEEHINNCRTWFTQSLTNEQSLTMFEHAVSYFALLIANLNLNKMKDVSQIYNDFSEMINDLPNTVSANGIASPHFWFKQAELIWKKEIDLKSTILKA